MRFWAAKRWLGMGLWGGSALWWAVILPPAAPAAEIAPHVDHRQRQLEFTESAIDPQAASDRPEVGIAWFGPAHAEDPLGGDLWVAATLAVEEANAAGGCQGRPFRLRPRWAANPWGSGVRGLFRLVYDEPVVAVLGSVDGASTHLAEQVVAKARLPLVSPVSTDASVNYAGVPWMFSCAPGDAAVAGMLAQAIAVEPGSTVLVNATDHDSRALAQAVAGALADEGRPVAQQIQFTPGGETFVAQLRRLAAAKPERIVVIAGAEDSARFLRGLRQAGVTATVFGSAAMAARTFVEQADGAAEGVRFPLLVSAADTTGDRRAFESRFTRLSGKAPDYRALLTYDATTVLLAAIREAGPDREGIRVALRRLTPWTGIAGRIDWDGLGRNLRAPAGWGTICEGRVVPWYP